VSRKATELEELLLGASEKRKRRSLIGGTVVEDYNSNLHGGRVVIVKLPPKPKAEPKKPRKAKAEKFDPLMTEYPAVKATRD